MSAGTITRLPGEPLVTFYNRKLAARGRHDVEWFVDKFDRLRLREKPAARRYDLADPE